MQPYLNVCMLHLTSSHSKMSLRLVVLSFLLAFVSAHEALAQSVPYAELFKINRVIGGKDAGKGEFPHQVTLQYGHPPFSPFYHVCGGSIIKDNWVVTAAHCVYNLPKYGQFIVIAGKNYVKNKESTEQRSYVTRMIVHQKYQGSVSPYDIALLKLTTPFKFNRYVTPINLPQANVLPKGNTILSGWGSISKTREAILPNSLQKVTLPIIDLDTCRKAFKRLGEPWNVHDTNVCTGPLSGGFSACNGDSGGPLIKRDEQGIPELVGIVSWGSVPCGGVGAPAVFVRVSAFIDWINYTMATYYS